MSVISENFQGNTNFLSDEDDKKSEQIVVSSFENDLELHNIEQEAIIDAGCPYLFIDQQELILLDLEDPFSSLLT